MTLLRDIAPYVVGAVAVVAFDVPTWLLVVPVACVASAVARRFYVRSQSPQAA